jgi:hypothetical protein
MKMIVQSAQRLPDHVGPLDAENAAMLATARTDSRQAVDDDLCSGAGSGCSLPKKPVPGVGGADPRRVYGLVHDELTLDAVPPEEPGDLLHDLG